MIVMTKKFLLLSALTFLSCIIISAQPEIWKVESDVYCKYSKEIAKAISPTVEEIEVGIQLKYNVPYELLPKISRYIRECECRKACYNYIFKDSVMSRYLHKVSIDSIYRDSINRLLIPVDGSKISGENVSLALKLSKAIKLDDAQYENIMENALRMARCLYKEPRTNVWNEEMEILKKTLTTKQLSFFFQKKYSKKTNYMVEVGWQKIVDAGLDAQLDKDKERTKAYIYYQEQQRISDLYRYKETQRKRNLVELDKNKPNMIRILETLENQKKQLKQNKNVGKDFVW